MLRIVLAVLPVGLHGGSCWAGWVRPFQATRSPRPCAREQRGRHRSGRLVRDGGVRGQGRPFDQAHDALSSSRGRIDQRSMPPASPAGPGGLPRGCAESAVRHPSVLRTGAEVLDVHPEIKYWAVGGHSLGGTTAAAFADRHPSVKGLILYASYPAGRMTRTDLKVLSVSGSADRFATPADIEASKANLPAGTQYVVIEGAVHSTFGDYGAQPGDGTPTTDRVAAQAQIVKATADRWPLTPPPRRRRPSRGSDRSDSNVATPPPSRRGPSIGRAGRRFQEGHERHRPSTCPGEDGRGRRTAGYRCLLPLLPPSRRRHRSHLEDSISPLRIQT